jgi:hypothetical protein
MKRHQSNYTANKGLRYSKHLIYVRMYANDVNTELK